MFDQQYPHLAAWILGGDAWIELGQDEMSRSTPDGMINPLPIEGTKLWLEANQSSDTVSRIIRKLLLAFGHQEDEFQTLSE